MRWSPAGLYSWSCKIIHDSLIIQLHGRCLKLGSSPNSSCLKVSKGSGTRGTRSNITWHIKNVRLTDFFVFEFTVGRLKVGFKMGLIWVFISHGDIKMWVEGFLDKSLDLQAYSSLKFRKFENQLLHQLFSYLMSHLWYGHHVSIPRGSTKNIIF